MKILRGMWMGLLAAMLSNVVVANDDELATMKASMAKMQAEMDALRAGITAERETLRSSVGGAPEALRSANGNATIRIGGDFRVQYGMGLSNGYFRADNNGGGQTANFRSASAGWALSRAQLQFDIDLSCDTAAVVDLRLNGDGAFNEGGQILNQAYWRWNNVGGSGFGIKVGLMNVPFGMWANTENGGYAWDSIERALITKPLVMNAIQASSTRNVGGFYGTDLHPFFSGTVTELTNFGLFTAYNWDDQMVLQAGLMASARSSGNFIGNNSAQNDMGLTTNNDLRNIGFVDHVINLAYNPCWLEGLHLEMAYMGQFDDGKMYTGNNGAKITNPYGATAAVINSHGDHSYRPSFDFGVVYKFNEAFKVFAEAVITWQPFYSDGFAYALSVGMDYALTERLMLGAALEMYHLSFTGDMFPQISAVHQNLYRLSLGAKYNFGNGIFFQAQYYHDLLYTAGFGDQNIKDADVLLLQTGYTF